MSVAERKAVAERLLTLAPDWSDRRIAEAVGLSDKTVTALRPRPSSAVSNLGNPQLDTPDEPTRTTGADGKARPATATGTLSGTTSRAQGAAFTLRRPRLRRLARQAEALSVVGRQTTP